MEISFTPTPDVVAILNALLNKFENRSKSTTQHATRSIKITLNDLGLPAYFSQFDPQPRLIANHQLQILEHQGLLNLTWLPGEQGHLLQSIALRTAHEPRNTLHAPLYALLNREPLSNHRARLESLILAEKFRFEREDWRARALDYILNQLRAGKSPSPFSLTDSNLDLDLLSVLQALPTLTTETPYRVFSVRVFNNSKRFEDLKPSLVRLARRANPDWKSLNNEDLLRELNLVANPGYIHLSGNWELTDSNGQIINIASFIPSIGFPASQIASIRKITIRAESVRCIENLTSFHEYLCAHASLNTKHKTRNPALSTVEGTLHATICLMGNPSPAIRHLLRLIPEGIPIHLWADMDYGGFNILAQLRKKVSACIQPYLMDIATFEKYAHLSRPLTQSDTRKLKRMALTPTLKDVHPTIEHILKRGLKLEQEAIQI